jgi:hypothetical protein
MRDGFREIISGWMLTDDVEGVGEYIEAGAAWARENGPLEPDEQATVRMMIQCQVARGIRRGDFEPFIPADADDATIREILNFDVKVML